jgi:hypothetical protein
MRGQLIAVMVGLPTLAILNSLWFGRELKRTVRAIGRLQSTADLERYKRVVARQMSAALVQLVLLAAPPILFGIGAVTGLLGMKDLIYVVLPAVAVLLVAAGFRRVEAEARQIPAESEELARQRDAVVRTWLKRPLPDW